MGAVLGCEALLTELPGKREGLNPEIECVLRGCKVSCVLGCRSGSDRWFRGLCVAGGKGCNAVVIVGFHGCLTLALPEAAFRTIGFSKRKPIGSR